MTEAELKAMLESELASERATTAGLRKERERIIAEADAVIQDLATQRGALAEELRQLRKKLPAETAPAVVVNVPSDREVN
jgi:hypothetical protein